jgi:tetratricopeptide (TPR) repeat protein
MSQSFDYLKPVIMDLINCDRRKDAWNLIDFYFERARTLDDYDVLGYVSLKADKRDTYLACAEATYALSFSTEQRYKTRINLFKAYNAMNYPEKALEYIEQNLQITPDDFETHCHRASNISLMGDKQTAEQILEDLVKDDPLRQNKIKGLFSGKLLREGKLAEGIETFFGDTDNKNLKGKKQWNGLIKPGEKIYVEGVGGLGDEIINIRFLDRLKKLGMDPILYSGGIHYRRDIDNLFARHGYKILNEEYSVDPRCAWVSLMSLPATLNLKEQDLWTGPYLTPIRNPKNKLESNKFKIGIKCSGNPYFGQDEYRKIPLETMLKYLPQDAEIYYIDTETGFPGVINLGDRITCWEDTFDFIDQMDCIVSSCTSLVHAAGAMGKTTFVAVPIAEYYIWTTSDRSTHSPWYGENFHVMRQTVLRSWDEPLAEIAKHVDKLRSK